jgi:hypothetical protein
MKKRIPVAVLEKARQISLAPKPPLAPAVSSAPLPREKIVAALKKLHPMD